MFHEIKLVTEKLIALEYFIALRKVYYLFNLTALGAENRFLAEKIDIGPSLRKTSKTFTRVKFGATISASTSDFGEISGGGPISSSASRFFSNVSVRLKINELLKPLIRYSTFYNFTKLNKLLN